VGLQNESIVYFIISPHMAWDANGTRHFDRQVDTCVYWCWYGYMDDGKIECAHIGALDGWIKMIEANAEKVMRELEEYQAYAVCIRRLKTMD
jgi:hypothetical protein